MKPLCVSCGRKDYEGRSLSGGRCANAVKYSEMTNSERQVFELGQQIVLAEVFDAVAELEKSCSNTSYGRGQLYILRELVGKLREP
jgi:hypothetical protein